MAKISFYKDDGNVKILNNILDNYTLTHPNICTAIKMLLAASPITGPIEKS